MRPIHSLGIVALSISFASAGCSKAQNAETQPSPQASNHQSHSDASTGKTPSGRYPFTEADVDFMSHMIGHHAQALVMAGWAPSHGASASVRTLCERIINGQQDEIVTMQRWLRDRGKPVPEPGRMGTSSTSHHQHSGMPGMLTRDQLQQLDQARGSEFDRLFLTFMIQHHRGAVSMVQKLFATPGAARDETVFKFANDVSVDQRTEVARMERMLAGLPPKAGS
jgi:uncharacterized protein (DUF305 family)